MSEAHIEAVCKLEAMRDGFAHETDERATLSAVLELLDDLVWFGSHAKCGYCGEMAEMAKTDEEERARWQAHHAAVCPKHPMREVERERDLIKAKLDEQRVSGRALFKACRELDHYINQPIPNPVARRKMFERVYLAKEGWLKLDPEAQR